LSDTPSLKITEVNTSTEFFALENVWKQLLTKCDHTVFSTWEWVSTWWRNFNEGKKLRVIYIEQDGRVIALAPMMYSVDSHFGLRTGTIEFLGSPQSDYNNFLISERQEECQGLFIQYLEKSTENWALIDLQHVPSNADHMDGIKDLLHCRPMCDCYYIPLPSSYDAFLKGLGSSVRYKLRKDARRLSDAFDVTFEDCSGKESVEYGMSCLFSLHQKRWLEKGQKGAFNEANLRNFHQDIAKIFGEKGWLNLKLLKISGKPIAAIYGFKYGGKFYQYLNGLDPNPQYFKYGIGNQLMAHNIADCIDCGLREVDLLRGDEPYKTRWTQYKRKNFEFLYVKPFTGQVTMGLLNFSKKTPIPILYEKLRTHHSGPFLRLN
jgi:CelD/BcsL family acetyltransferase involved in cellulose biosynthesis